MVKLTRSMSQFLFEKHRDVIGLVGFGHVELITQDIWDEYIAWCKTDHGKEYLEGGAHYEDFVDSSEQKG